MNQETFRMWAGAMKEALENMDDFLENNTYERIEHPFRREVVKDSYYEARNWAKPGKTVPVKMRIKALLFYVGGQGLVNFAKLCIRLFR
jgi:hypothetical protein